MPLLIMVTLHIPIFGMHDLVYVHNTFYVYDSFSSVTFGHGKSVLFILMGIRLPSLPVSVLYRISVFLFFVLVCTYYRFYDVEIENL